MHSSADRIYRINANTSIKNSILKTSGTSPYASIPFFPLLIYLISYWFFAIYEQVSEVRFALASFLIPFPLTHSFFFRCNIRLFRTVPIRTTIITCYVVCHRSFSYKPQNKLLRETQSTKRLTEAESRVARKLTSSKIYHCTPLDFIAGSYSRVLWANHHLCRYYYYYSYLLKLNICALIIKEKFI